MSAPLIAAREALAKVLAEHEPDYAGDCNCSEYVLDVPFEQHVADALLASDAIQTPAEFAAGLADATEQDRADVRRWLIEEADNRVRYFPQRRDGVDALIRALAAALAERPTS